MPRARPSLAYPSLKLNQATPPSPPPLAEGDDTQTFKTTNVPCSPLPPACTQMGRTSLLEVPTAAVQAAASHHQGG